MTKWPYILTLFIKRMCRAEVLSAATGAKNDNYLPLFGLYVNVTENTIKQKVQIKSVTITDLSVTSVEYVVDGMVDSSVMITDGSNEFTTRVLRFFPFW